MKTGGRPGVCLPPSDKTPSQASSLRGRFSWRLRTGPPAEDLSSNPLRIAAVHDLLLRILDAERDSLIHSPTAARLSAPLPDPPPPEPPADDPQPSG